MPNPTHLVRRLRASVCAIALLPVVACAAGDAGGAPFDANGTLDDLAAVTAAFDVPAITSFAALGDAMDAALGAPLTGPAALLLAAQDPAAFGASGRALVLRAAAFAHASPAVPRPAAVPTIPGDALGGTWAWSPARTRYVRTAVAGAPADGTRFLLYATDPATRRPALPLRLVGHVDLHDAGTAAGPATRVRVATGAGTVLEYVVSATEAGDEVTVTLAGTATQVRFVVTAGFDAALDRGRLDVRLDAPARGVSLDWALHLADLAGARPAELEVLMSGPHGNVVIGGTVRPDGAGTLDVLANGVAFAVVGRSTARSAAAHPDGTALAPSEEGALLALVALANEGSGVLGRLLEPVDGVPR